ncbi:MAG: sulfotransferase family protein [Elainella sp. Prado103]|jgi:hypothetical protein|nr:sulfotransferase family protein [Elainella sp. Prado103]
MDVLATSSAQMPVNRALQARFCEFMPKHEFNYHIHISLKNKFIYVEVPKVACSTLKSRLQAIEAQALGQPPPAKDMETIHNKKLSPLLSPSDIGIEQFDALLNDPQIFKFCFVRNPYTRVLSAFLSKLSWKEGKYRKTIADALDQSIDEPITFQQFLQVIEQQSVLEMDPHWRTQSAQLFGQQISYDLIGRFETLEQDWQQVLSHMNQQTQPQTAAENRDTPKRRGRKTGADDKLAKFYAHPSVVKLVQTIYQEDFKTFQYSPELPVSSDSI